MKKIFTLAIGICFSIGVMAQTQRMVLTEEFTNASCGPCAGQNPAYNALIAANSTKIVAIKYQVNFPGVDPMNAQNPTEVATRRTYYAVSGVPYAPINGDTVPLIDWAGTGYTGGPYHYDQAIIDSAYDSPSPFAINLTHSITSDLDSIYITCVVNAAQAVNLPQLFLRMAIIEREIVFASAPGTNGETEFFDVMRKMVPNATGTSLSATWTNGQNQTFTFGVPIPSYIYNPTQIAVVAFIQEDATKQVQQAAISQPAVLANYASISAASTGTANIVTCNTTITPSITILNEGSAALTSATISYSVDAGNPQTVPFTGNVSTGQTTQFSIPALSSLASGQHVVVYTLQNVNGSGINSTDFNQTFYIVGASQPGNAYTENFLTTVFPYSNWININDDAVGFTRSTTAGFGTPKGALKMDFYNSTTGKVDEVILPPFSYSGFNDATLTFKVAAKAYPFTGGQTNDTLMVSISADCGNTWNQVWLKSGAALATVAPATASYTATANADYRDESVLLPGTANASQILVKFTARSDYGNNAYVDNINITATSASLTINATNVTCNGGNNGSATCTPVAGTAPYTYSWNTTPAQTTATASNLTAGTYTVTVTDSTGATYSSNVTISQPTVITIVGNVTSNSNSSSPNGGVVLTTSGGSGSGYQYLWSNGATTQNLANVTSGTYSVVVTDGNGCTKSQSFVVSSTVGFAEITENTVNSMFPNPAGNLVTFSVQTSAAQSKLEVFDAVGKLVIAKDIAAKGKQNINVSTADLNNGVYFIRINGGQARKLMIQH